MVSKGFRPLAGPGRSPGLAFLDWRSALVVYSVMNEYNPVGQDALSNCRPCGLVQCAHMESCREAAGMTVNGAVSAPARRRTDGVDGLLVLSKCDPGGSALA